MGNLFNSLLHFVKQLLAYDLGNAALNTMTRVEVHADIALIFQHGSKAILVERHSPRCFRAPGIQRIDNLRHVQAGGIQLEHFADDRRADWLEGETPIRALLIPERQVPIVDLAIPGVIHHAPLYILRQVCRIILGCSLQHGLQQNTLRAVGDAFLRVHNMDAIPPKPPLVDSRVLPIPGKAVNLPADNDLEDPLRSVLNHALELRALIRCCGLGAVYVFPDNF